MLKNVVIFIKQPMIRARRIPFASRIKFLRSLRSTEISRSTNTTFRFTAITEFFCDDVSVAAKLRRSAANSANRYATDKKPRTMTRESRLEFFISPMTNDFMQGKVACVSDVINVKSSRADPIRNEYEIFA